MAEVKATLTADIGPLKAKMAEASAAVGKFGQQTQDVDAKLKKFGNEFSGERLIARANAVAGKIADIGGAARLTDAELKRATGTIDQAIAKYTKLGQEAPAALRSLQQELTTLAAKGREVAASVDTTVPTRNFSLLQGALAGFTASITAQAIPAIKQMVTSALEAGGRIADLSAKTGLTTTQVQQLSYAAEQTGASIDTVTGAVSQLSNRLVEGGTGTVGAVRALGLELSALQAMKPGDAFMTIADAIAQVPDPMRQTQLAMELFGRAGAEILPAIKAGLSETALEAQRLGLVISEDNVQALDDLGDAWDRMALRAKVATAGMIAELAKALRQFRAAPDLSLKSMLQFAPQGSMGGGPFGMLVQEYLRFRMGAPDPVDLASLNAAQRGGDIRLPGPTPVLPRRSGGSSGSGGAAPAAEPLRGLYNILYESAQQHLKSARVNYDASRGFLQAAKVQLYASSDSGIRGAALQAAISGGLTGPGPGVSFSDSMGGYVGGIPANASKYSNSIASVAVDFQKGLPSVRSWKVELQGVVQAFANLAQIAGPAMGGVARGLGTVLASASAGQQLAKSLADAFPKTFGGDGNNKAAAVSGGVAGLGTGIQVGSLFTNRGVGFVAGAAAGAGTGFMATGGNPYGALAGGVIGGISGMFAAATTAKNLRAAKDVQAAQLVAQFGSLEELLKTAERVGMNQQSFLEAFYGEPKQFAQAVSVLNQKLAEEKRQADALAVSLQKVAKAQGVLSQAQLRQVLAMRKGGPGADVVNEFLEGQTQQAETGILSAVEALSRYGGNVLQDFGGSVQAAAAGLAALFGEALARGESAVQILGRLGGAMTSVAGMFTANGGQMPAGFEKLQDLAAIVSGQNTGIAVQTAGGLGSALAGFQNTGVFKAMPELFGSIANGIGSAWKALENFGAGGQRGLAIFQPYLQTLFEIIDANPELKDQLDDQTRAALDFAAANGTIGPAFRDSSEKMLTALDRLIAKMGDFINALATAAGLAPQLPGAPAPPPNTPGNGSGSGGDYEVPLATGGIVTRPTRALIGEAGPEAVIPLSKLRMGGQSTTQTIVVNLDGRVLARSVAKGLPSTVAVYGAA